MVWLKSYRCADGFSMANPGQQISLVFFDALASAPAIAQLPPVQFAAHKLQIDRNPRR